MKLKVLSKMRESYGSKKGKQVFYASKNAGKISGVEKHHSGKGTKSRLNTAAGKMFFGSKYSG